MSASNFLYKQDELLRLTEAIFESDSTLYRKKSNVFAKPVEQGLKIETITEDGVETTNVAQEGDYLVKNQTQAQEQYLIGADKLSKNYEKVTENDTDGFSEYKSKGKVLAVQLTTKVLNQINAPDEFYFEAPWKDAMIAKKEDFLVRPLEGNEIYRIAQTEFVRTYEPIS